jgi:hypothetical protein
MKMISPNNPAEKQVREPSWFFVAKNLNKPMNSEIA